MPPDEIDRTLQRFLATVAAIERSRLAAVLLADPGPYLETFHAQVGDPRRAAGLDPADAATMRQILELATDAGDRVNLTGVGSALRAATAVRAIPERPIADWQDARSRIAGYLAESGPLPGAPGATAGGPPSAFGGTGRVTREEVLRVVIEGGILGGDPDRSRTFTAWREAPPFCAVVERVVLGSLVDLVRTLSAMRQHIVQPAVTALASTAPVARPVDTA